MFFSFSGISEKIRKLACYLETEPDDNRTKLNMLEKTTKELVDTILEIRNYYYLIAETSFKKRMYYDVELNKKLNININKNGYGYVLSVPFLLPKSSHSLKRSFWHICFEIAVQQFEKKYNEKISIINNPVVIFENQFVSQKTVKGLKDANNYELSDILNFMENYFFVDDRSVTLIVRNCGGFKENKTVVHIVEERNLTNYIEFSNILLHSKR